MTSGQIPFIVGVIREKEKSLLEQDEYTRLIDDITSGNARSVLTDTAYGLHLAGDLTPAQALDARLYEEFSWLVNELGANHPAMIYIAARYDALHIANALIDYQAGKEMASAKTRLGLLSAELLTSTIWRNHGWEDVPAPWRTFMQEQRDATQSDDWSRKQVLEAVGEQYLEVLKGAGKSKLMKSLTALTQERTELEKEIRPDSLPTDLVAYEKEWDEKVLTEVRKHRFEPDTIDAIVAWWYALAIEVKTIRLLLLSIGGKTNKETLTNLTRSLYRSWI